MRGRASSFASPSLLLPLVVFGLFLVPMAALGTFGRPRHTEGFSANMNVRGGPLRPCSAPGMAATGFTRTGSCDHHGADAGSHHVCVSLRTKGTRNFCALTGQPNWCDEPGPCHGNRHARCPKRNWCVCQWAYDRLVGRPDVSCDDVAIDCDATHMAALEAYRRNPTKHAKALRCLERQCLPSPS